MGIHDPLWRFYPWPIWFLYELQKDAKEEIGSHYINGFLCEVNTRCIATRHHHYSWSAQLQYIAVHCSILKLILAKYTINFWLHHYCPPHFTKKPQNKMLNKWGNKQPIVERVSASSQQIYPPNLFIYILLQPQVSCFKRIQWIFSLPRYYYQRDDSTQKTSVSGNCQLLCDCSYSRNKMCEENYPPSKCVPVTNQKRTMPEQSSLLPSVFYQRAVYDSGDGNMQPQSLKGSGNDHKLSLKEICSAWISRKKTSSLANELTLWLIFEA